MEYKVKIRQNLSVSLKASLKIVYKEAVHWISEHVTAGWVPAGSWNRCFSHWLTRRGSSFAHRIGGIRWAGSSAHGSSFRGTPRWVELQDSRLKIFLYPGNEFLEFQECYFMRLCALLPLFVFMFLCPHRGEGKKRGKQDSIKYNIHLPIKSHATKLWTLSPIYIILVRKLVLTNFKFASILAHLTTGKDSDLNIGL